MLEQAWRDLAPYYPTVDGKPTVAYLWARTVTCKHCRASLPLLKTRWLCKKGSKRIVLTIEPNSERTGEVFGVQAGVPTGKGNTAHKRTLDKRIGGGTMSKAGADGKLVSHVGRRMAGRLIWTHAGARHSGFACRDREAFVTGAASPVTPR